MSGRPEPSQSDSHPEPKTPAPTWKCEYCGRFYSERTAAAHGWCQQEEDRKDAARGAGYFGVW